MSEAVRAYRSLLRAVKTHVSSSTGNPAFQQYISTTLKQRARAGGDPELARDYAFLLNSIAEHKDLLLSYNIGIDPEQRQKDQYKKAASRVGLSLPEQFSG
ncbi:hypothetical protein ACKKBG_A34860 [Auxenochlorella protothecoides x Auxenochlorella symbiontica]